MSATSTFHFTQHVGFLETAPKNAKESGICFCTHHHTALDFPPFPSTIFTPLRPTPHRFVPFISFHPILPSPPLSFPFTFKDPSECTVSQHKRIRRCLGLSPNRVLRSDMISSEMVSSGASATPYRTRPKLLGQKGGGGWMGEGGCPNFFLCFFF